MELSVRTPAATAQLELWRLVIERFGRSQSQTARRSVTNGSSVLLLVCELQLTETINPLFGFDDVHKLRCAIKDSPVVRQLKSHMAKKLIKDATQRMFASLHDVIFGHEKAKIDSDPLMVRVNSGLFYCTCAGVDPPTTHLLFRVSVNDECNLISISCYSRDYYQEVRLFATSDLDFFRGVLVATNLLDQTGVIGRFEIPCTRPFYLHGIARELLGID